MYHECDPVVGVEGWRMGADVAHPNGCRTNKTRAVPKILGIVGVLGRGDVDDRVMIDGGPVEIQDASTAEVAPVLPCGCGHRALSPILELDVDRRLIEHGD